MSGRARHADSRSGGTGRSARLGVVGGLRLSAGPERFWANWILWFLFLFTVGLGCLFIVALEHLVGAKWSVPMRRVPERLATLLLPVVPVGAARPGAAARALPWTRPEAAAQSDPRRQGGLAQPALLLARARSSASSCGLLGLAILVRGSLRQDATRIPPSTCAPGGSPPSS